jgi:hypothetical protein
MPKPEHRAQMTISLPAPMVDSLKRRAIAMGVSTGQIIWFDLVSQAQVRRDRANATRANSPPDKE